MIKGIEDRVIEEITRRENKLWEKLNKDISHQVSFQQEQPLRIEDQIIEFDRITPEQEAQLVQKFGLDVYTDYMGYIQRERRRLANAKR